jgi:hypothetical protein
MIIQYGLLKELDRDLLEVFIWVIRELDEKYLAYQRDKQQKRIQK